MNPKDQAAISKVPLELVPPCAVAQIACVMLSGDIKYGRANWRDRPIQASTYISACQRHLAKYRDGEVADPETGISHLAHAAATLCIMLDAQACETLIDDRPTPCPTGKLMDVLQLTVARLQRNGVKDESSSGDRRCALPRDAS